MLYIRILSVGEEVCVVQAGAMYFLCVASAAHFFIFRNIGKGVNNKMFLKIIKKKAVLLGKDMHCSPCCAAA